MAHDVTERTVIPLKVPRQGLRKPDMHLRKGLKVPPLLDLFRVQLVRVVATDLGDAYRELAVRPPRDPGLKWVAAPARRPFGLAAVARPADPEGSAIALNDVAGTEPVEKHLIVVGLRGVHISGVGLGLRVVLGSAWHRQPAQESRRANMPIQRLEAVGPSESANGAGTVERIALRVRAAARAKSFGRGGFHGPGGC